MILLFCPMTVLEFDKCNMRLKTDIKPKEATFQVVLDVLALIPFYQAFLIDAEVLDKFSSFALKFQDKSLKTSYGNMISSLSLDILGNLETSFTSLM
ncbi:hypothetical protein Tco_0037697 [Tanacetum coccineum]